MFPQSVPNPLSIFLSLPVSAFFLFLPFPVLVDSCYFFQPFLCSCTCLCFFPVLVYVLVPVSVSRLLLKSPLLFTTLFMFQFLVLLLHLFLLMLTLILERVFYSQFWNENGKNVKCLRSFIPHSYSGMDRTPYHPLCSQVKNEQNVANAFCTNHSHSRIVNKKTRSKSFIFHSYSSLSLYFLVLLLLLLLMSVCFCIC